MTAEFQDDSFKTFVIASLILHLVIVFSVSLKNMLFSNETIIVPQAMRVDIVALPDKVVEAPPAPAPVTKPVALPPPKPIPQAKAPPKENVKDSEKKAFEKLKELAAIDKIKSDVTEEKAKPEPEPTVKKGNIVSSGSSFSGISQLRVNEYLASLTAKVRDHWTLPQWLSDANLKAAVLIDLDAQGALVRREIYTSSGNSVFDASCLSAVADAAPFAPPPNEVKNALLLIRFPFE
jgi:colicin import membrane protein